MRIVLSLLLVAVALVLIPTPCRAQDFKPYPGAKLDEQASRDASAAAADKESQVFTTDDAYDRVYAFYKALYKEGEMRYPARGPAGIPVKMSFFLIDGGKDLRSSKYWMKVQRPFIYKPDGKDVRDVTVIQTVRSK